MFYEIPYEFSCSKNSTGIYINNEDNKIFLNMLKVIINKETRMTSMILVFLSLDVTKISLKSHQIAVL